MSEPTSAQMNCGYCLYGPPAIYSCGTCPVWREIESAPGGIAVLVWKANTKEHYVAARVGGAHGPGWCTPDGHELFKVTHWMPLPEPPDFTSAQSRGQIL